LEANNGAGPRAQSGQATVPGTAYKFGGTRAGGTSPNTTALVSGANVWMNPLLQYTDLSGGTADAVESASSTTTYYGATISSTGSLGTLVMDNFTLVSVVPIPGMQPGQAAVQITATTPSSAVGTQVVFESGDASNANCIRLERRDDTHLHLVIYYGNPNAAQYDVDLGAITASTQFTVLLTAGVDTISYSLDGGARTYLQQTTIPPGMGILWAGRSWLGTIQRLTVWPTALPAAPFLIGYGDSLMYGTGATNFPGDTWQFKLDGFLGRRGSNQGIGGETSSNIADRFVLGINNQGVSHPELQVQNVGGWGDPRTMYILEGGYNDHTAAGYVEANFKRMSDILDAVGAKYLVMGMPTADVAGLYTGGADRAVFDSINTNLSDAYGARYVNIDAALKAQSTHTGQDAVDDGHDIVPASQRADGVHWNNTGHLTVFNTMLARIQSLGWEHIHERHRRAIGRTAKAAGYV
jgi:lysophospholipase L1-like esterase